MHRLAITPRRWPDLGGAIREKIAGLAGRILAAEPRIGEVEPFGPLVRQGLGAGLAILFGDTAEIPLLARPGEGHYDYRLAWLARSGDIAVIGGAANPAFEDYQRQLLGEAGIRYLRVETEPNGRRRSAPAVCLKDEPSYRKLREICAPQAEITLMPHIATGTIWGLAARLARDTGTRIRVAGPPPRLGQRVNDKLWFGAVAAQLLGAEAVPEKRFAFSASALARHVLDLAPKRDRLVLKVPDSAGSVGNILLQTGEFRSGSAGAVFAELRRRLAALPLEAPYPIAVEVWDANVLSSPSVQVWIPRREEGEPVIEGIYEQVLEGELKLFVGAIVADLPAEIDAALAAQAMQLALLFQALGYFGRCSFDAILTGRRLSAAAVRWVECNGRWGGVSIPMTLVNRLADRERFPAHVIVQEMGLGGRALRFERARRMVDAYQRERADAVQPILLNPGVLETGWGVHLLARAATPEIALESSQEIVARLRAAGRAG